MSLRPSRRRSAEFLGESDEKPLGPADVAEPMRVFILDDLANEPRSALLESRERVVDVVNGEHDAKIAESVHRSVSVSAFRSPCIKCSTRSGWIHVFRTARAFTGKSGT
jgi:hypothetical protein